MANIICKSFIFLFIVLMTNNTIAEKLSEVKYTSYNPTLRQLISGDYKNKPISLTATLILPDGDGPFPTLVWVPGRHGQKMYDDWGWNDRLKMIVLDRGIALLNIDNFTGRGINPGGLFGKGSGSGRITNALGLTDIFTATNELIKDKRIDSSKIYIAGHSFGGLVSILSSATLVNNGFKDLNVTFAGHIPIAPECWTRPHDLSYDGTRMLIIAGENDDDTPVKHCVELVSLMKPNSNVEIKIITGATHHLMSSKDGIWQWSATSTEECGRRLIDDKGGYTLIDKGNFNNVIDAYEYKTVEFNCIKNNAVYHEYGSAKIREELESLISDFFDKFVVPK